MEGPRRRPPGRRGRRPRLWSGSTKTSASRHSVFQVSECAVDVRVDRDARGQLLGPSGQLVTRSRRARSGAAALAPDSQQFVAALAGKVAAHEEHPRPIRRMRRARAASLHLTPRIKGLEHDRIRLHDDVGRAVRVFAPEACGRPLRGRDDQACRAKDLAVAADVGRVSAPFERRGGGIERAPLRAVD